MGNHKTLYTETQNTQTMGVDDLGATIEKYSMEYSGFFVQVLDGATFQNVFHHIKPVIDDFKQWVRAGVLRTILEALARTFTTEVIST